MAETIFHPAFGNRPDQIVGREQVIDDFVKGLRSEPGHRERAALILGQRGMGKTALLLELADRAGDFGYVVARVTAGSSMLEEILEVIQIEGSRYVGERKTKVRGFSAGALGFSFGLTFAEDVRDNYGFRVKLSLLCDRLAENGKGVLILVDEVQSNTDEMRQLATTYQHLVGDRKNIAIVMAGLPSAISRVINDDILTFLNRARKVALGPLSLSAISTYYSRTFAKLGKTFAGAALDRAVEETKGFPYLLQLIGYYLVELSREESLLSEDMVGVAVKNAKRDLVDTVFLTTLNPLSDGDIRFLEAMSEDQGSSKIADIRERMKVSEGYIQPYRKRLLDAGVIAVPRRGEVEFAVPYLGNYLRGEFD